MTSLPCCVLFTIDDFRCFLLFVYSQKVIGRAPRHVRLSAPRRRVKDQEVVIHLLITLHYTSLVTASVAVVWC